MPKECFFFLIKNKLCVYSVQFYGECWSGDTAPMTYDRYGQSSQCTATVGGELANMVYRFVGDGQSVKLFIHVVCLPSILVTIDSH